MKAITLIQPWASLIALGEKHYETRSWGTHYRGPIAIHAGKRTKQAEAFIHQLIREFPYTFGVHGIEGPEDFPFGRIVAVARLVDCRRTEEMERIDSDEIAFGDWSTGRYAWALRDVKPIDRIIECRGYQGLWDVPAELEGLLSQRIEQAP